MAVSIKKIFYGAILLLLATVPVSGQMPLDSMRMLSENAPDWKTQKYALMDLTDYYRMRNHDSVFYYVDILEKKGRINVDGEALVHNKLIRGQVYHGRSELEKARIFYHQALKIAENTDMVKEKAWAYINLGLLHGRGYDLDSSYYYLQEAEKNYVKADLKENVWRCYSGYANINKERRDFEAADRSFRRALATLPDNAPSSSRGFLLYQVFAYAAQHRRFDLLSEVRVQWDEYKGARQFDIKSLERPEHIALYSLVAGEDIDMEQVIFDAIEYYKDSNRPYLLAACFHDLGEIYYEDERFEDSKLAYERADSMYTAIGYSSYIATIRKRLAEIYQREGNYAQALAYTKATYWVLDSLKNKESERNLRQYQVQYETEKKEQQLQINQLQLKQKTQERNVWISSSAFLALLGFIIYGTLRQRMRQRELITNQDAALQEQRIQQLEQEKTLLALSSMIEGQELERQRIAKDLHDGMGGLLTTIKAHYSTVVSRFADQDSAVNIAPLTGELIDRACTEVRRISQNMMPAALLYSGLAGALEDLATQVRTNGLECTLEIVGDIEKIDETRTIALYRVMQEAVNNILKHARAKHVLLQLIVHQESVNATIEDDGVGFVFEAEKARKSLGLNSMDSRVRYLKGQCDIDSVIGEGTAISLQFPLA
jgi:signal transduction histidine kinase